LNLFCWCINFGSKSTCVLILEGFEFDAVILSHKLMVEIFKIDFVVPKSYTYKLTVDDYVNK